MRRPPKDYYEVLGVPENARPQEIKKAYRKLALEFHPDHNKGDPKCEEKFKEITEAYGALMDPVKRREFDRYRAGFFSGVHDDSSQFRYSQQDIFENMFRDTFARDVFEELNREFSRFGFRSGPGFFQTVFFGGALGGLGKLLWLLPGPFGKIGHVLRLVQMVGSSLLALNQARAAYQKNAPLEKNAEKQSPLLASIKNIFRSGEGTGESIPDMDLQVAIPSSEAASGIKKRISYKIDSETEQLMVSIPSGIQTGKKLRIKEKGYRQNGRRGDLILCIRVE